MGHCWTSHTDVLLDELASLGIQLDCIAIRKLSKHGLSDVVASYFKA